MSQSGDCDAENYYKNVTLGSGHPEKEKKRNIFICTEEHLLCLECSNSQHIAYFKHCSKDSCRCTEESNAWFEFEFDYCCQHQGM